MTKWMAVLASLVLAGSALGAQPLLLRNPSLSQDRIAFLYADDVWTVARAGGEARRLTSVGSVSSGPFYSPDGSRIAYSVGLGRQTDVYVVDAAGGVPRRLTWWAGGNSAEGWTPDGKEVLFSSAHSSPLHFPRLFHTAADGSGSPVVLPLPSAESGAYAADGNTLAYVPVEQWQAAWKHYRGGQTTPIWLVDLKTLDLTRVPREHSNDRNPVWFGGQLYFLSDRDGPVTLYHYDPSTRAVARVVDHHGFDLKSVAAGPGGLVYEQFGSIHLLDPATHHDEPVAISIRGDLPALTPHLATIPASEAQNFNVSPSGARVVVEAHGDIFTVPAEKGDTRNLTQTPGAAERDPAWSPDGKSIAYFSDASGEYQLVVADALGAKAPRFIDVGPHPSFYYGPQFSPDSKWIAYTDKHLNLWYVEAAGGKPVKVDTALRGSFTSDLEFTWSPDSRWIAYRRDLENQQHAIFLYSLASHAATQLTDGMSDAGSPAFDPSGKYLYFTASTNSGPSTAGIDLSSLDRAVSSSVYAIVLARDGLSPVPPESDEEKAKQNDKKPDADKKDADNKDGGKKDAKKAEPVTPTVIDLAGIGNRILALPIPARNYTDLAVGKTGVLFLAEGAPVGRPSDQKGDPTSVLWRFTTEKRQTEMLLGGVNGFRVSADGEKLFYVRGKSWFLAPVAELKPGSPEAPQGKPVNNGGMVATIDRRAEWRQMYRETWRIERDFLYDPNLHGLDLAKIVARYQPYVDAVSSRAEFTYLCEEMLGEIRVGHMFIRNPEVSDEGPRPGFLGADYSVDGNRYRFAKIFTGQNWTPSLAAPLTLPGVHVSEGDYLLAVNGRELSARDNVDSFLDGTVGRQTVLRVAGKADGSDARDVTVVPVASEAGLRNLDWIESNRHKVDALSGGRIAYVYMPNTGGAGYTNFNRYFYAQLDKQGVVLDERYNGGGFIADYVVNVLGQKRLSGAIERDGKPVHDPEGAIFGPKAMIINQSAGSGGDAMPWYFRKAGLGTLVGVRTWGGLVGIGGYPTLVDGGSVTAPRYAIYGLNGEWEVEGNGIAPDVEVEELPKDVAAGHDLQLERAVAIVLEELRKNPPVEPPVPPYPNYHRGDGLGSH